MEIPWTNEAESADGTLPNSEDVHNNGCTVNGEVSLNNGICERDVCSGNNNCTRRNGNTGIESRRGSNHGSNIDPEKWRVLIL